tara:strand:- start:667 stop:1281 length:615 start_codon:yes stop_codon:yes gene_type:complete
MEETTKYGHKYISPHALVYGDYGGAGSVGVANVRAILEMEEFQDSILRLGYRDWDNIDKWSDDFTEQHIVDEFKEDYGPPKVVHLTGAYGSNTLWLLECEETEDIIASLADYPLIDEDLHSQVELEWEEEAWEHWTRSELYDGLPEELQEAIDDKIPSDGKLYEAYRLAMESTNTYPVSEQAGVYIDTKAIQDEYENNVRRLLT